MIPHNSGKVKNCNKIIILDFNNIVKCIHILMILSSVTNGIYDFGTPSESRYLNFHSPNVIYLNTCCRSFIRYEFE